MTSVESTFMSMLHTLFPTEQGPWFVLTAVLALALWLAIRSERLRIQKLAALALGLLVVQGMGLGAEWLGMHRTAATLSEGSVLLAGMLAIRLWVLAFFQLLPRLGLNSPRILQDVVTFACYFGWGLTRLHEAGVNLSHLVTTSAIVTAVIALSMQDTLGNLLGGLAMHLEHSISLGDWISFEDISGQVMQIRWRSTTVMTRQGELVVIPNASLVKTRFRLLGRKTEHNGLIWRRQVCFYVGLDQPPARIQQVVEQAMKDSPIQNVSAQPEPQCVLLSLEEGAARYGVRFWIIDFNHDETTDGRVRERLVASLARHAIPLGASVQHRLHQSAHEAQAALQQQEMAQRLRVLQSLDLFAPCTEEERLHLARHLVPAPFAANETITRQGAIAHWLYILAEGQVHIWRELPAPSAAEPSAAPVLLTQLQAPDFFGEMGLMTGAARRASVVAANAVHCYRLDKSTFEQVLHARPALAENLSQILAKRMAEQAELEPHPAPHHRQAAPDLLDRIRKFFSLGYGKN